ncbi:hypothetical protein ACFYVE_06515 [Streptomyces tendae]|uniref:hypothetical protein n=1 Tax=Streptomyces tendae TaxID=1932 RepID=UPI0036922BC6
MVGHRPSDWHVLDLDKDPTPGDPQRVRTLAKTLHDFADDVSEALDLSAAGRRPGTPEAGVYLTDDFTRAATGYGRGGHVVRVQVPEEFAQSVRQMGGPAGNQPEFFVNTPEGLDIVNNGITDILPTQEATLRHFAGLF